MATRSQAGFFFIGSQSWWKKRPDLQHCSHDDLNIYSFNDLFLLSLVTSEILIIIQMMRKFAEKFKSFVEAGKYSSTKEISTLKRVLGLGNICLVFEDFYLNSYSNTKIFILVSMWIQSNYSVKLLRSKCCWLPFSSLTLEIPPSFGWIFVDIFCNF